MIFRRPQLGARVVALQRKTGRRQSQCRRTCNRTRRSQFRSVEARYDGTYRSRPISKFTGLLQAPDLLEDALLQMIPIEHNRHKERQSTVATHGFVRNIHYPRQDPCLPEEMPDFAFLLSSLGKMRS